MAYCRNCGADAKNARLCPYCGQAIRGAAYGRGGARGPDFRRSGGGRSGVTNDSYRYYREDGFDPKDVAENRYLAILCYLNILFLLPLLLKPGSAYIRFHCNQGLLLTIFTLLVSVASRMPLFGLIAGAAGSVFAFACFIRGILNAVNGRVKNLPIIGVFTIIS